MNEITQRYTLKKVLSYFARASYKPLSIKEFDAKFGNDIAQLSKRNLAILDSSIVVCADLIIRVRISSHHCADKIKIHCL